MKEGSFRKIALLGTYFIALILILIKIDYLLGIFSVLLSVLKPLFIGVGIAFVLSRLSNFYYRFFRIVFSKKLANVISILLAYVTVFLIVLGVFWILIPELVKSIQMLINNISTYFVNVEQWLKKFAERYQINTIDFSYLDKLDINIKGYFEKVLNTLTGFLPKLITTTTGIFSFFSTVLSVITTLFISLILSIYLITGRNKIKSYVSLVAKTYMPKKVYNQVAYVLSVTVKTFSQYIVGQCTEALILGSLCFIGMLILNFDYPLLISVLVAVTALIPVLGAYLGGGISAFLLLIISPIQALGFLAYLIVLQQIENNLIYPKVVGESLGLPAILVLLSVTVGGGLFGLIGMIIGVPTATVLYRLLKNDVAKRNPKANEVR